MQSLEDLVARMESGEMTLEESLAAYERGELTPKLSVKRRVIDKTYKALIDSLYEDGGE